VPTPTATQQGSGLLTAFGRAFKTPDLRKKLIFTFLVIALFRLGSTIPAPGVDYKGITAALKGISADNQVYSLINLFSGGALLHLSIFALGIMPYITSSIIMQLLIVVIPRLERLKDEGESGNQKITQYTRYLTIGLAILQSTGIVALARSGNLFGSANIDVQPLRDDSILSTVVIVISFVAGTAMIMWLGELITDRGIGNGMSILIFTSIASRLPFEGGNILRAAGGFVFTLVCLLGLAIVVSVVFIEQAQRRIPVQYAKRMVGRRMYGGSATYIPLKVNQAGVIPVIFASSLLYLPQLLAQIWSSNKGFTDFVTKYVSRGDHPAYLVFFFALIIFFAYFYTAITFNPTEVADNMKKYGGFIPGIRPGRPTAEYLDHILNRITLPGALFLASISVLPFLVLGLTKGQQFPFGGTAVLIMVGVGLETVKQIESQLMMRNYEGFLR
jgi:preprotein translocase subunit SecY